MAKSKKKNPGTIDPKQIAASTQLVTKASGPFTAVARMTAIERKRAAKLKRGAHQVIPQIAQLAQKFGVMAPGNSVDDMLSNMEHARNLEPLLAVLASLYQTVRDEHLRSTSEAWKTATVTYGMLKKAGEANQHVLDELEPVRKWFRHARSAKPVTPPGKDPGTPVAEPAGGRPTGVVNGAPADGVAA